MKLTPTLILFLLLLATPAQMIGFPVMVVDPGNDPLALDVDATDLIEDLKQRIFMARGYPVDQQVLVHDGSRLADSDTVADNTINTDDLLYLSLNAGASVEISSVSFDSESMHFRVDQMTTGITQVVEQSPELKDPSVWVNTGEFSSDSDTTDWIMPKPGQADTAFYRIRERNPRPEVTQYQGYELFWHDEFEGPDIDPEKWQHQLGDGTLYGEPAGWGNAELQLYTDSPENSSIVGDGEGNSVLLIEAKRGASRSAYSSAKLVTEDLQAFRYGRIEARIRLPYSQGAWPAFWMLGVNKPIVEWPGCGEIDIMEMLGGEEETIYGTAFYVNEDRKLGGTTNSTMMAEGLFSDVYHVYGIDWTPTDITWHVDGVPYHTAPITADMKEFQRGFYLILNIAVGGFWPGNPDTSSVFPMRMFVDWVRVYTDPDLVDPGEPPLDIEEETFSEVVFDGSEAIQNGFEPFESLVTKTWGPGSPEGDLSPEAVDGDFSVLDLWNSSGYGGMWWQFEDPLNPGELAPQDLSSYTGGNLVMALKIPETVTYYFEVKLESQFTSGPPFGSVNLLDYTPVPLQGGFVEYTIPLSDFTEKGFNLELVTIPFALWNPQSAPGVYLDAEVLIDNVHWTLAPSGP